MKRLIILIFTLEIVSFTMVASIRNGIGGGVLVSYSSLWAKNSIGNTQGAGVGCELFYEYNKNLFLMQIGAGVGYVYHNTHISPIEGGLENMIDSDGDLCVYNYAFTDLLNMEHRINIEPKFMVGGTWNWFYFLVGVKMKLNLIGTSQCKTILSTSGTYDNLIAPLESMDRHFFYSQYPLQKKHQYIFRPDFDIVGEFGINIPNYRRYSSMQKLRLQHRLSLFVESSILNISPKAHNDIVVMHIKNKYINDINVASFDINPLYNSNLFSTQNLYSFSIGIKWTMVLSKVKVAPCRCQ